MLIANPEAAIFNTLNDMLLVPNISLLGSILGLPIKQNLLLRCSCFETKTSTKTHLYQVIQILLYCEEMAHTSHQCEGLHSACIVINYDIVRTWHFLHLTIRNKWLLVVRTYRLAAELSNVSDSKWEWLVMTFRYTEAFQWRREGK